MYFAEKKKISSYILISPTYKSEELNIISTYIEDYIEFS